MTPPSSSAVEERRGRILRPPARRDAALVFPLQAARGWFWGGTYEFNRVVPAIHETVSHWALGLARSGYTIVKTVFWLGGWSFLRASAFLVIACDDVFSLPSGTRRILLPAAAVFVAAANAVYLETAFRFYG